MDNTSGPIDLNALGFIGGPVPFATPGINTTYPNQNPAPKIADVTSSESPGFFGSLIKSAENYGQAALDTIEEAPSHFVSDLSNGYGAAKSAVSTVGSDVGGGLNNILTSAENHIFLIFGVAVVGVALVLWSAGKSGAIHANVIV